MKKSKRLSVFYVILLINVCSIVVLSAFNYYIFHYMSDQAYLDSFLSYNQRVTELAFHNIDHQIIQSMVKIPQLYFSPINENAPILLAQEESLISSSQKTRELITEMKKIQKACPYLKGINICYEATGTVVTSFDKIHYPGDEETLNQYLPWYQAYKEGGMKDGFMYNKDGIYLENEPVITYFKKISRSKWGEKQIVIALYVDPLSFGEYIDLQEGALTILTQDGQLLYDSGNEGISDAQKILPYVNSTHDKDMFSVELEDSSFIVFSRNSSAVGLKYLYRMDTGGFYKDYRVTRRMFLINFLISIVFNLIVLLVISYYSYTTYSKRVITLSKNTGIVIDKSKKSFDSSLTVLEKEITQLRDAKNSSRGLFFQNMVRSIVLDRNMEEGTEDILPYLNRESACVFLIFLSEHDMEGLMLEELQKDFPSGHDGYDVLFTTFDKDSLVAVLILNDKEWEFVKTDFIKNMDLRWESCIMVSGNRRPIVDGGIKESYVSAAEAAHYRYIFTNERYLPVEQIRLKERKESGSHLKLFEAIRRDMNHENLLEVKTHLEMLVTSFKNGNYTVEYCLSTLRDLVALLYQTMQQYQLDMWIVFGYDIRDYYKKIPNIDAFYDWCDGVCEMILKNIYQKKQAVDADVQTRIIKLVEDNLENNISLDYLADQLNVRPDVASRIFRQIMGKGYTEYIKEKKLNRAVELLSAGFSVKEIAERLCYSSAQYFIKVFKDNYGITPYQYKKNREKESSDKT